MDSQRGIVEQAKSQSLNRQSSLYSLTLDEVQNHLGSSGKALGSMNLDELLKSVCSVEANQPSSMAVNGGAAAQEGLSRQGSLTLPRDLSKKTVDEVWKDIQQNKNGGSAHERRDKQPTLGEMTLEDLLLKAGVVTETIPAPINATASSIYALSGFRYASNGVSVFFDGWFVRYTNSWKEEGSFRRSCREDCREEAEENDKEQRVCCSFPS
ncbi:unnamed protein product [Arabidopsis thaliana]|uniref:(thale cress) hypothetical protein n=1 Tax=Arabidopsis thaliana TaxID=3702 RepID=A0A7G2ETE6_ARATH|nr:unnamed protein product [Arabidopsis thaliana]